MHWAAKSLLASTKKSIPLDPKHLRIKSNRYLLRVTT